MKVGSNGRELMRQMLVNESVVGRVENLMEWSANPLSDNLEKAGFADFVQRPSVQLLPPTELSAMRESHLALLLARLGAAIADALSAERQAQFLQDAMDAQRISVPDYYASKLLAKDIETDRIFDDGPAPVMHRLEKANYSIRSCVQTRQTFDGPHRSVIAFNSDAGESVVIPGSICALRARLDLARDNRH